MCSIILEIMSKRVSNVKFFRGGWPQTLQGGCVAKLII